ncbi:MAG: hypothetical protein A3F72_16255 [Bacteroidetes bacterium RIFCSPLOWO2_12_FULL_35_15]|nr:MAG: hypothetical protein A3F72_16255 [Bacteroidetes bacterium RIFCSPLOWO2_12_FULL_35_15]
MKTKIAFISLCFFTFNLFSQDTIVKLDRTLIIAKVLEISPTEINYSLYNSQERGSLTISKSEISSITYSNGIKELFNTAEEKIITKKQEEPSFTEPTEKKKPAPSRIETRNSKKHRLSISTSLFPLILYEERIDFDYCYKYRHSFGFSLGNQYPSAIVGVNVLANQQERWPGCVYKGTTFRINYKYFLMERRRLSLSVQLLYKTLSYNNHLYENRDGGYWPIISFISEKAKVYGWDLLIGFQLTKPQSLLNLETFASLGYRRRIRDYTILKINYGYPTGSYHLDQDYPMATIGFKLGINTFFK